MTYEPAREPRNHQRLGIRKALTKKVFGVLMEQGTGKTKVALDVAGARYEAGRIDALAIVAPKGVDSNWITDEIPKDLPERIKRSCFLHRAGRNDEAAFRAVLSSPGLAILAMNIDAVNTELGAKRLTAFLKKRRAMMIVDESTIIKTPRAKRTRKVRQLGKLAPYRMILTGTPAVQGPFDLYSQFAFLDPRILGHTTFTAFKSYYGRWRTEYNGRTGQSYPKLDEEQPYRNLDELTERMEPFSFRATKDVLDLPPKVYQKRRFELTEAEARAYQQLREETFLQLSSGELVTAPVVIARMTRLAQIASGFVGTGDGEPHPLVPRPARLDAFLQMEETIEGQGIAWCRFKRDVDLLVNELDAVRYDGAVSDEDRKRAIDRFRAGEAKWFVGNPAAGGRGITLVEARTVVYYANSFNLEHRLQSEDRAHRIGQTSSVLYVDMLAEGTIDERVIDVLRAKKNVADLVTGDGWKEWI